MVVGNWLRMPFGRIPAYILISFVLAVPIVVVISSLFNLSNTFSAIIELVVTVAFAQVWLTIRGRRATWVARPAVARCSYLTMAVTCRSRLRQCAAMTPRRASRVDQLHASENEIVSMRST
jgi:hypothetical protein